MILELEDEKKIHNMHGEALIFRIIDFNYIIINLWILTTQILSFIPLSFYHFNCI